MHTYIHTHELCPLADWMDVALYKYTVMLVKNKMATVLRTQLIYFCKSSEIMTHLK